MKTAAYDQNNRKLMVMAALVLLAAAAYLMINVNLENSRMFAYAMKIRIPKLAAMGVTAVAIGGASLVFQSIIGNKIGRAHV